MKIDLYKIFFPVGWVLGLWGAFVWILFKFNVIEYPGAIHPELMMGGFLLSFVLGFLGTAVPRFTASFPPRKFEIFISFLLSINIFLSQLLNNNFYFRLNVLVIFVFLAIFLISRFMARQANPPVPFIFVGIGVLLGVIGSFILLINNFYIINQALYNLGRLFYLQGYVLSFVVGVGSRLIPSLFGYAPRADENRKELSLTFYIILGVLFFSSYLIEAFINRLYGSGIRSLVLIVISLLVWKIYRLPKVKSFLTFGLWLSCVFLVVGHTLANVLEVYYLHFIHLFYISGLSLMTFMVASRVTLSHGGYNLEIEKSSKIYLWIMAAFILAAFTRLSAGFLPEVYINHLAYAALVWIVGVISWGVYFLQRMYSAN